MAALQQGRWTHQHDGAIVVFLIGMRVNKPWRPDRWLPVILAMPRMLRELHTDPARGFLGERTMLGAGGPTLVQYWRSVDDLYAYASAQDGEHRPAWTAFNRHARAGGGAVGIWHETYVVPAGGHESIYADMPPTGLAAVTSSVGVTGLSDRARQRLGDTGAGS